MIDCAQAGKFRHFGKLLLENAFRFAVNLLFITVFQLLFGMPNTLMGVAIGVGFTMFPTAPLGIKPLTMAGIIVFLFTGCGIAGQTALLSPFAALAVNFLFTALILALCCEPLAMKPSISFLLCFVFSQATPVAWTQFPQRLLGGFIGGLFVAAATLYVWRRVGLGFNGSGRSLMEQVSISLKNKSYILRMSAGISIAMFIGMVLGLKKPLWISIVVMSLTQAEFRDTFQRIQHRFTATLIGIALFVAVFNTLVPSEFSFLVILFIGYVSFFLPEYRHKQVINAICAINASLVLLDTTSAVKNRLFCLVGGILIVLALCLVQYLIVRCKNRFAEKSQEAPKTDPSLRQAGTAKVPAYLDRVLAAE